MYPGLYTHSSGILIANSFRTLPLEVHPIFLDSLFVMKMEVWDREEKNDPGIDLAHSTLMAKDGKL